MMIDKTGVRAALQSSRIRRCGSWIAGAVVLFGILGFLALPPLVRHVAANKLSEILHRPVSIREVAINPFDLSLAVEGFDIGEREGGGTFFGFESLYVNLRVSSLFRWGPVVEEMRLTGPKLRVARVEGKRYNFSDLVDEFAAGPKDEKKKDDPPPAFSLNNIQISGGTIEFDDRVAGEKHVIGDIGLTLPFLSSMADAADVFVEPRFSANVDGAPLEIKGRNRPFADARDGEFKLALDKVPLPKYFDYFPADIPVKLVSGALNADLTFVYRLGRTPRMTVSGAASIENLNLTEASGSPLLAFRRLDVAVASADLLGGDFAVERLALDSPDVTVRVNRAGTLNWLDLLAKAMDSGEPAGAGDAPVKWSFGETRLTGGALRWIDESHGRTFRAGVEAIDARLQNLDGQGSVADFELAGKIDGGESLKVDAFAVRDGKLDLAKNRVSLGEIRLAGSRASIRRSPEGKIDWIEPPALRPAAGEEESASPPWTVEIAKSVGEGMTIRFEDAAVSPVAIQNIEGLGFELTGVSSEPDRKADVKMALRLNRKGEVAVDGKLGVAPFDADLNLSVKTVELLPLQPYFSGKLNVVVKSGHVTAGGRAQLRETGEKEGEKGGEGSADGESGGFSGGFAGQVTIGDFQAVEKTGDSASEKATGRAATGRANSADSLRWKSFHFGEIDARFGSEFGAEFGPESVSVGDIALSDFFARVIVSPEGRLNLLDIVRGDGPADAAPETPPDAAPPDGRAAAPVAARDKPTPPVRIGKITLQGGSVRFTDNFVKPNYTANLRGIGGSVTGLSSEPGTQARLELRGSYDNVAPLNVSARINPLSAKPYLDLQAEVQGVDLTSLSAYSGKYAGYAIDKGKLSLSVKYKIENDRLEAENRVFLDQLTFGEAVESPDATALPVRLAVALLKNGKGEIDVNLPISGSLDDPQFSVGGLIVKVVVNLLTKAVASPFALIGSMFGGGEELSNVEFDPGRAALTPVAVGRLETLSRALVDKPDLKFEIAGRADPERDTEGVKRARLDRKIRALKREDAKADDGNGQAETAAAAERDYPDLLERVYGAENFPKPRNMVGLVKRLPVEEMEKLILANSAVSDEDLKNLADRRAKAARDWLAAHGVPAERMFLLPSKVGVAEEGQSGCRADFSIK
ncbi:MAG: DUF748 domain-containing protein [Candidatus Accumulibacter sp.]|nr:DUF748 domain-containing protein [Accumulibacter sp.]